MKNRDEVLAKLNQHQLVICDTTLRDGEQAAGIVFANLEKMRIAKLLDEIGVQQIEAGIPAMGGDEKTAVKNIAHLGLDASILGWNRANPADIAHSIDCDVDSVAISMSSSDIHIEHKLMKSREWVIDRLVESIEYAKAHGLYISANAEDASRADKDFIITFAKAAKEAGADRFRYCDTLGILEPRRTYDEIKRIIEEAKIDVEMHTHNDFGMATANALAGVQAGAKVVSTTVLGIGERTGNTPVEAMMLEYIGIRGVDNGMDTTVITDVARYFEKEIGYKIPENQPFVGANFNVTKAGIHADGMMKDEEIYNIFDTNKILKRHVDVGITDKSGVAGIAYWLNSRLELVGDGKVDKHHHAVKFIKAWVDEEYVKGRTTGISEQEMWQQVEKCLPELLKELRKKK